MKKNIKYISAIYLFLFILIWTINLANAGFNVKQWVNKIQNTDIAGSYWDIIWTLFNSEWKIQKQYLDIVPPIICTGPGKGLQFNGTTWECLTIETYSWHSSGYGNCSKTCGGGIKTRISTCKRDSDGSIKWDEYCTQQKPLSDQACNAQICVTYNWRYPSNWSTCSGGKSWSNYGGCSVSCGPGTQRRTCWGNAGTQKKTAYCRWSDGSSGSNSQCGGNPPVQSQYCNTTCSGSPTRYCNVRSCISYTYSWRSSTGICSNTCEWGSAYRSYTCYRSDGVRSNGSCGSNPSWYVSCGGGWVCNQGTCLSCYSGSYAGLAGTLNPIYNSHFSPSPACMDARGYSHWYGDYYGYIIAWNSSSTAIRKVTTSIRAHPSNTYAIQGCRNY